MTFPPLHTWFFLRRRCQSNLVKLPDDYLFIWPCTNTSKPVKHPSCVRNREDLSAAPVPNVKKKTGKALLKLICLVRLLPAAQHWHRAITGLHCTLPNLHLTESAPATLNLHWIHTSKDGPAQKRSHWICHTLQSGWEPLLLSMYLPILVSKTYLISILCTQKTHIREHVVPT